MKGPTIYISNWSSHKTEGHHGPGRKLTIMANPRHWERGEGYVPILTPTGADLALYMKKAIDLYEYRLRIIRQVEKFEPMIEPGLLEFITPGVKTSFYVESGDTLCCACSRIASVEGRCHRRWIVPFLLKSGWNVVIDGVLEERIDR